MADYSKYRYLKVERDGKVLKLSLNRPERLNAVNAEMHTELAEIFAQIRTDPETFAVLLTGEGRGFCAGGDIKPNPSPDPDKGPAPDMALEAKKIVNDILETPQPIIAAINGDAVGFGATIALFCDVMFCSDRARLGDPHVRMGATAGDGGAVIFPMLCGVARAKELLMTGDLIDAQEAHRIGLVNHVVAHDELMDKAMAFAQRLAEGPPMAIRTTKMSVNKLIKDTNNLIFDIALQYEISCLGTEDQKEAVKSFIEKREPKYTGR
jgi:enoyl-CoA hydratase